MYPSPSSSNRHVSSGSQDGTRYLVMLKSGKPKSGCNILMPLLSLWDLVKKIYSLELVGNYSGTPVIRSVLNEAAALMEFSYKKCMGISLREN